MKLMTRTTTRLELMNGHAAVAAATELLGTPTSTPVLLRSGERRWFGTTERVFNPLAARAELLRPRSN